MKKVEGQQGQEFADDERDEIDHRSTQSSDGCPPSSTAQGTEDTIKFKLLSPMDGRPIEFVMSKGQANTDVQQELQLHLSAVFRMAVGIQEAFESAQGVSDWKDLPWSNAVKCEALVAKLNKCISKFVSLWGQSARPDDRFENSYCSTEECKQLSNIIFNRAVKNVKALNKCYDSFSSRTYGETSFDQIQAIMDRLHLTQKDVFLDLGSGVGHVVTFVAAYTLAKCIGIEINEVPAKIGDIMKEEFKGMMSWYGKKHGPVDLLQGSFLDEKYKNLITREATVIYINNFAFDANLMLDIRKLVNQMPHGTRIICTQSLLEERGGEADESTKPRRISARSLERKAVDLILDMEELPVVSAPVSWCEGKKVPFLLFTVNHNKTAQIGDSAPKSNDTGSSTRSAYAQCLLDFDLPESQESIDKSIAAAIAACHAARVGTVSTSTALYPATDEDDDDLPSSGAFLWHGLKAMKLDGRKVTSSRGRARPDTAVLQDSSNQLSKPKRKKKVAGSDQPSRKKENGSEPKPEDQSKAETEPKPEDKFPFGKVAALGHDEDYDKETAPEWAAKVDKNFVGVYAPHHSIFDPDPEPLPEKRVRKSIHDNLKM